jgi:DNA-binding FadR family transcriptional regulator
MPPDELPTLSELIEIFGVSRRTARAFGREQVRQSL